MIAPRPGNEIRREGSPGFADGRRENADPAAFWPSTRRGRLRTVASPCQDRHVGGGGGLAGRTVAPPTARKPRQHRFRAVYRPLFTVFDRFRGGAIGENRQADRAFDRFRRDPGSSKNGENGENGREPARPRTGLLPTTRGIRSRPAQAATGANPLVYSLQSAVFVCNTVAKYYKTKPFRG